MYAILFVLVFAHERIEIPNPVPAPTAAVANLDKCHAYADTVADRFIAMFPKIERVEWSCIKTT